MKSFTHWKRNKNVLPFELFIANVYDTCYTLYIFYVCVCVFCRFIYFNSIHAHIGLFVINWISLIHQLTITKIYGQMKQLMIIKYNEWFKCGSCGCVYVCVCGGVEEKNRTKYIFFFFCNDLFWLSIPIRCNMIMCQSAKGKIASIFESVCCALCNLVDFQWVE